MTAVLVWLKVGLSLRLPTLLHCAFTHLAIGRE